MTIFSSLIHDVETFFTFNKMKTWMQGQNLNSADLFFDYEISIPIIRKSFKLMKKPK